MGAALVVLGSPEGGLVRVVFSLAGKMGVSMIHGDDVAPMSIYTGASC